MPVARTLLLCVLASVAAAAAGPPAIRRNGVVNAASQRPESAGGAIAPSTQISIHGVRFAPSLPANRVLLRTSARTRELAILRATATRLDAWIPAGTPSGDAQLTVRSNGLESAPESIHIRAAAPGLFSVNQLGWGPAQDRTVSPGETVALAATGIPTAARLEIHVGAALARILSFRPAAAPAWSAGISIRLPPEAPEGCYVPVYTQYPGAPPSNTVTVAIHRGGGPCADSPDDPLAGWEGGKTAILAISRTLRRTLDDPGERVEDELRAGFFDVQPAHRRDSPVLQSPAPGTCSTYSSAIDSGAPNAKYVTAMLLGAIFSEGDGLDAGDYIALRNASLQLKAGPVAGAAGMYRRTLSPGHGARARGPQLTLDSGSLVIAGPGGSQVGPFAASLPVPAAFTQTNLPAVADRSRPLTVAWNNAVSTDPMAIVLGSADANAGVAGFTYCRATAKAGTFTIPAPLLAHLPPGRADLVLASWWTRTVTPNPSGIQRTVALSVYAHSSELRLE